MLFTIERWDNSTISMMLLMTAIMLKANTAPNSTLQVTLTMVVHRQESPMAVASMLASCVDLTTPLDHETFRSSIDVREIDSESGFVCPF